MLENWTRVFGHFFCFQMKRYKFYRIAFVSWTVFIMILLLLPGSLFSDRKIEAITIPCSDKIVHFFLFFVFAFLLHICLKRGTNLDRGKIVLLCILSSFVYGLAGETMQYLTYDLFKRTFNLYDLLADVLGALFALVFLESRKKKMNSEKKKTDSEKEITD